MSVRFGVFTVGAARDFKVRTQPYERFAAALVRANAAPRPGDTVYVAAADTMANTLRKNGWLATHFGSGGSSMSAR